MVLEPVMTSLSSAGWQPLNSHTNKKPFNVFPVMRRPYSPFPVALDAILTQKLQPETLVGVT
ncbi:MAG: hypothetical protein R3330_18205 [Saprospiraceae bacterium]|nr:hypothetical protein [Saprospiraceae bacterium]